ncbi:MAG: hypothetical protein HND52_02190 [Ignavibacteriae bacterium]|nr:hypothetical protein [Ignavibacteriota bacterium]NOG96760.1 hypothetical protein [Ignavibacteriota bacterium]
MLIPKNFIRKIVQLSVFLSFFSAFSIYGSNDWLIKESKNFKVVYRESHSHLAKHILESAEKSLAKLSEIFNYTPSEKIIINTYDVYDYGFASATSVPQNFIRLEIEPFEPGYENIPYNERFQWLLNHELVHVVVNDAATDWENFFRTLFSKVQPEQQHPMTILYSLLTNYSRYTPHWHQESIAVFWETWLSGGYGRVLGSFDEMFFRAMVHNSQNFPCPIELVSKTSLTTIYLEKLFYIYGGRFASYLSIKYGVDKLVKWFKVKDGEFYKSFYSKFKDTFDSSLEDEWENFVRFEIEFQAANIKKLISIPTTKVTPLYKKTFGWVTQPYYDRVTGSVIFGYHNADKLATIQKLYLRTGKSEDIETLPTPILHQVASTAFSSTKNKFYYTTNNNQLYRDIRSIHLATEDKQLLFEDYRVGAITVADKTNEMWGVQHSGGSASLVYSDYPYQKLNGLVTFKVGEDLTQLSISPNGEKLAAVIHLSNGSQSLVIADSESILTEGRFQFDEIYTKGSPENPSWNSDGSSIYFNAFTNGVSNIYRYDLIDETVYPISHSITGLFKPIYLSDDKIFAFEYHYDGFLPVEIPNKKVDHLPAIKYLGQNIIDLHPDIFKWTIYPDEKIIDSTNYIIDKSYNSLANLDIISFVPVVSGFQKEIMVGFYTHISDPLITHDLSLEFGVTPFKKNSPLPYYHVMGKYEFKKIFELRVEHNAPDFYDIFNERKRGMVGTSVNIGYTNFWYYDNPLKIKQKTEFTYYTGIEFFNDNLIPVSGEDFLVGQTVFSSKYLRRSIGSSGYEHGNEFKLSLVGFGQSPKKPEYAAQVFSEWSFFTTWFGSHNVLHLNFAGGYHHENKNIPQAKFYFGGFGNRYVENIDVKQFRDVFRFPGTSIYSLPANSFGKILIENSFPPIRFSSLSFIGKHILTHIDVSIYSQGLVLNFPEADRWVNIGGQVSFVFKHWFNLESTITAGAANAWWKNSNNAEWFVSLKLLKN